MIAVSICSHSDLNPCNTVIYSCSDSNNPLCICSHSDFNYSRVQLFSDLNHSGIHLFPLCCSISDLNYSNRCFPRNLIWIISVCISAHSDLNHLKYFHPSLFWFELRRYVSAPILIWTILILSSVPILKWIIPVCAFLPLPTPPPPAPFLSAYISLSQPHPTQFWSAYIWQWSWVAFILVCVCR